MASFHPQRGHYRGHTTERIRRTVSLRYTGHAVLSFQVVGLIYIRAAHVTGHSFHAREAHYTVSGTWETADKVNGTVSRVDLRGREHVIHWNASLGG